jgi:hypothetical protein
LCALARVALWVKISFAQLQRSTGINVGQLTQQARSNNPLVQTQMLAAAKDVRAVGTQTIDGVRTTHYAGSYPVSADPGQCPAGLSWRCRTRVSRAADRRSPGRAPAVHGPGG